MSRKPVQPVQAKAGKIVPIRTEKRGKSVSDQFKKQHLSRPRTHKRLDHVERRIGRLRKEHSRVAPNYEIIVTPDDGGTKAVAVTWELKVVKGSMVDAPGVCCLRSNILGWDAEEMWRTHTMLTDVGAVFRSLKSELGLRPVYHQKQGRADAHLFI